MSPHILIGWSNEAWLHTQNSFGSLLNDCFSLTLRDEDTSWIN
nr:MAG TPA: hypothetical protein [Caudoviricetes sp.]